MPEGRLVQRVLQQVQIAGEDLLRGGRKRHAEQVVQGALGGEPFVVGRARQFLHEDERRVAVAARGQAVEADTLGNGIAQAFAGKAREIGIRQVRAHGIERDMLQAVQLQVEMALRLPPDGGAARIGQFRIPGAGDVMQRAHGWNATPLITMEPGAISPATCAGPPRSARRARAFSAAWGGTTTSIPLPMFHWR